MAGPKGWTAEMRIPFSQLRFNDLPQQVWGLNVDRWRPAANEDIYWIPVPHDATGWSSRMGELVGLSEIRPRRRLEVSPYAAGAATATGATRTSTACIASSPCSRSDGGSVRKGEVAIELKPVRRAGKSSRPARAITGCQPTFH